MNRNGRKNRKRAAEGLLGVSPSEARRGQACQQSVDSAAQRVECGSHGSHR